MVTKRFFNSLRRISRRDLKTEIFIGPRDIVSLIAAEGKENTMTYTRALTTLLLSASTVAFASTAMAQDNSEGDVVIATGIRQSLQNALDEKREANSLVEVILSEDIGKLPDQNLAEVLENVTGIQITRTAGVGTGVQIRGTDDNRVEVNGVSTVGSGGGRGGINFEDLSAGIIAGVEVIKSPEAKTIEGSVGGTVNLRTIRPLDLKETLASVRIQGENSSLSSEGGWTPRLSGTLGKKWVNPKGQEIGVVASLSYTEQEATSFRPRVDRDGSLVENNTVNQSDGAREDAQARTAAQDFDFLGIQFLNQETENFEFDTLNFAGTIEARPTDNLKLYFDAIITDQERRQDSTRIQASGVSSALDQQLPSSFETVNFGSVGGVDIGSIQAALTGTIEPYFGPDLLNLDGTVGREADFDDPNLRFSSDTGARVTDSQIIRLGGEWEKGNLTTNIEFATSRSDSSNPNLSTTLNFINPNLLVQAVDDENDNDNPVPFIYDLTGGDLTFGINFDSIYAPTVEDLTDPSNVVFEQIDIGGNTNENSEDAFRVDMSYDFEDSSLFGGSNFITSVDTGYRYNKTESTFTRVNRRIGGFSNLDQTPTGDAFASLLVEGASNFGESDGRDLAINNFLIIDPDQAFNDPRGTLATIENALAAHNPDYERVDLSPDESAFFDIEEETHSLYGQVNFDFGIVRGNAGLRYIDTEVASTGNTIVNGVSELVTTKGSYDFILPRINLVANPIEDVQLRFGYGKDVLRPDFNTLNSSITFTNNENNAVGIGNPGLEPEEVDSFDVSGEWYFAPGAVLSVGYFHKTRTNLFGTTLVEAGVDGDGFLSNDPSCPFGGIFNPIAEGRFLAVENSVGICVPFTTSANDPEETKQQGIEVSVQYDLSSHEDSLGSFGWASGFGILANYTHQKFSGGSIEDSVSTRRGIEVFNAINGVYDSDNFENFTRNRGLLDFSEDAYNITAFYEKYGLSARARYTWRSAFDTLDTAAGAGLNSTLGFPVTTAARGQLNAGINYDVTDSLNVGVEAVNLTKSGIKQYCVNDDALLCAQGIPDRRIVVGASYTF